MSTRRRSGKASIVAFLVSALLAPQATWAHEAPANPFYKSYAANGNDVFANPRFVMSGRYLSLDIIWSSCDGQNWPEGVQVEVRPLELNGLPAGSGEWFNFMYFNYGGFDQATCTNNSINPVHKDGLYSTSMPSGYPTGLYELRFRGNDTNTVFMRAKNTLEGEPPEAPSELSVVSVQRDTAHLQWVDNSANEGGFQLERSEGRSGTWTTVANTPADETTRIDSGLTPGQTYTYRVRAFNEAGMSEWSNELEVIPGCDSDTDCDGLKNSDEVDLLRTNPNKPDTDGDGLLDPWEAPTDVNGEHIENNGFTPITIPEIYPHVGVSRDAVFTPNGNGICPDNNSDLRVPEPTECLNRTPDPLHKDVFLEMDWQDCSQDGCPHGDPMHHAPDLEGLEMVVDAFADAVEVTNPDGASGMNLNLLIDESIVHDPNCDQDDSALRAMHFGTPQQRLRQDSEPLLLAKAAAVRYVWSGHSSAEASDADCPDPDLREMGRTALGLRALEPYDWSPFGDANLRGRDILLTLGPVWSCSSKIPPHPDLFFQAVDADCDRDYPGLQFTDAGIYPAKVVDHTGREMDLPWPIARMLGIPESQGITQLWARSLMHLLGHSLGLDEAEVANIPDAPAVNGQIRPPDSYLSWQGLQYAPGEDGLPLTEANPRYEFLSSQDHDGDGVAEGIDNCPGVANPEQFNIDFDKYGDDCDGDFDGDGLTNLSLMTTSNVFGLPILGTSDDQYPFDTDNDGLRNSMDPDDDNDAIVDVVDNCVLWSNPLQEDADRDGYGDACDGDADGNGEPDVLEQ